VRTKMVCAIAVLVCIQALAVSAIAQSSDASTVLKEANSEYHMGDYENAKHLYLEVLKSDEQNVFALYGVANCLYATGNYTAAIEYYERALEIRPDNVVLLNNLANTYYATEDYENAIAYYERALEIEPTNEAVLENMANAQYASGDYDGADATLKALERVRLPQYVLSAQQLLESGNYTGAVQYCQRALAVEPDNISLLDELSYAQYMSGDTDAALSTKAEAMEKMDRASGQEGSLSLTDKAGKETKLAELGSEYTLNIALKPSPDAHAGYVYVRIRSNAEDGAWVNNRAYYAPLLLHSSEDNPALKVVFMRAGTYIFQLNEADAQYVVQVLDSASLSELSAQRDMSRYMGGLLLVAGVGVLLLAAITYRMMRRSAK